MKIKKYFNTTENEVKLKKSNIFIPICLGNKFFVQGTLLNENNIKKYVDWALKNTKEKIIILIADKIQVTNYNVRNKRHSNENNLRRVLREGSEIKKNLEKLINLSYKKELNKIKIIQWEEFEKIDILNEKTTKIIYEEFDNNEKFKNKVFNTIKNTVTDRKFSDEKYWILCNYILDEFSVVYSGIKTKNISYNLFVYPYIDPTVYLIENIKQEKEFPNITKKLPKEKVGLIIMN